MDNARLTQHPELLDKGTLYELRSLVASHPCFQTARILLLRNLYLLHDPCFGEELRRSALYITDRRVLFDMVERAHYNLGAARPPEREGTGGDGGSESRTVSLIDRYLDSVPAGDDGEPRKRDRRKPTTADATIDYVAYLMEADGGGRAGMDGGEPAMKGQELIDDFIEKDGGRMELKDDPEYVPEIARGDGRESEDDYFTETLAQIYIGQRRYDKALEIIQRLNLKYPKKSAYFADQIRFLEKLIINNKHNK